MEGERQRQIKVPGRGCQEDRTQGQAEAGAYPRKVRNRGSVARLASMVKDRKAGLTRCTGRSVEKSSSAAASACASPTGARGDKGPSGPRSSSSCSSGGPGFQRSGISGSPGRPTRGAPRSRSRDLAHFLPPRHSALFSLAPHPSHRALQPSHSCPASLPRLPLLAAPPPPLTPTS